MLQLYDYYRSSAAYRVRIALQLKQLDYATVPVHLIDGGGEQYHAQYQRINPQCLIPALASNDGVITQSLAIIEYLDETYPHPALLPAHKYERALARSYAQVITADTHPLNNLRVLNYLKNQLHITDRAKDQWYQHWVEAGLSTLEKMLQTSRHAGDFCIGSTPTIADICLIPQLYNARRFHCALDAYPHLLRIEAHCLQLTAFTAAAPEATATSARTGETTHA